jgi:hypothetical protein
MKKLILFFLFTLLVSCGNMKSVSYITEQVELGMTKTQFLEIAGKRAEKDAMLETYYVYRVNQLDLDGYIVNSMFYYFKNSDDTLFKVDSGTSKSEVKINF